MLLVLKTDRYAELVLTIDMNRRTVHVFFSSEVMVLEIKLICQRKNHQDIGCT